MILGTEGISKQGRASARGWPPQPALHASPVEVLTKTDGVQPLWIGMFLLMFVEQKGATASTSKQPLPGPLYPESPPAASSRQRAPPSSPGACSPEASSGPVSQAWADRGCPGIPAKSQSASVG